MAIALASSASTDAPQLSIFRGYVASRSSGPASLSGITYAGGNAYYAIADKGNHVGLYKMTVSLSYDGRTVESYSIGSKVTLDGAIDLEGVAYDPGSGMVWAADEGNQTITEFDPATGRRLRSAPIPQVMKGIRPDYGFESLTISGDGLTMWTANEEALPVDGPNSSYTAPTTVRLVRFDRPHVDGEWSLTAMYAYTTEKWHLPYGYGGAGLRGVSDLCALPDGSLIVMERELSTSEDGGGFWAGLAVKLYFSLYLITPKSFSEATDVKTNPGLLDNKAWTPVAKTLLYDHNPTGGEDWLNMEGICLAQRIANGNGELLALTDAGDGYTYARLLPIAFSGMNIHTLSFARPEFGNSSIVGGNFRYLDYTNVRVTLSGMSPPAGPYEVDGSVRRICDGWTISGQEPYAGGGETAEFRVVEDGAFAWRVRQEVVSSGYHAVDSFEECDPGRVASEIPGWSGEDAAVAEECYAPPLPPGNVLTNVTHARVLHVDDKATRVMDTSGEGMFRIEQMVCLQRPEAGDVQWAEDAQVAVKVDEDGYLLLWHFYEEGGEWRRGWTRLSPKAYANREWIRLAVEMDCESSPDGKSMARIRVNGSCMPTARGFRSPADPTPYGAWHCVALQGAAALPTEVAFGGTRVDDLVISKPTVVPEEGGGSSSDGIPFGWFDAHGLPREAEAPASFIAGYTLGDVYTAGLDPYSGTPLRITGFALDAAGRPRLEFNGYKGEDPAGGYVVERSETPDFATCESLDASSGGFDGDAEKWYTTWTGFKAETGGAPGFYRVRARR